ncbi:hypothetical protein [Pseudosulfitobacter sp. DSM 107133]|jgi:hypothetical protein|uniref:hypothetical protein n=1 Tax=Pseudosulfitobacter sp. DSM 107133 TaxID=2883100 RepID=UPI001F0784BB|nr:hypothetical protein [Pseudosulfitobacter sp. DSM 107133]UOA26177.1 hypothetical protein DSM107133_00869 [Pseudosulfitobacter sp. DSM 107133]
MTTRGWILAFALAICGWLGVQLLLVRFSDAAPGAVALFPAADFVARLPAGVSVVGGGAHWIAVKSDAPDLGRDLYAAGARVVLPAGLPGCLPLRARAEGG